MPQTASRVRPAACKFPYTLRSLTPDQAAQGLGVLARLHARLWERAPQWAYTPSSDSTTLIVRPMAKVSARRLAALDRDDLWARYRLGAQYPCIATLIAAGAGGMQTADIAVEGLRRSALALEDLDTASLLKASL